MSFAAMFGLYTSYCYHFTEWGLDPDSLQVGYIWQGFHTYGLAFLKTHGYSPDNWLFSLIVPTIPIWNVIGPVPSVIIGIGWIAFLAIAVMAGLLTLALADRVTALAVTAFVLLGGPETLGSVGFMSHPASHDISLAWGLLAILLLYRWMLRGDAGSLTLGCVVLAADCVSDPWALVAIAAPTFCAGLLGLSDRRDRARSIACVAGTLAAVAIARTKAFGLLYFLQTQPLVFANWATMKSNAWWLARSVAILFNPFPSLQHATTATVGIACLAILLATIAGAVILVRRFARDTPRVWLVTTLVLSATLPLAAFILTILPLSIKVGRFAASLTVLAPVLSLGAFAPTLRRSPGIAQWPIAVVFSLAALSNILAGAPRWLSPPSGLHTDGVPSEIGFLRDHDLTYGYGEYWGALANSVTLVSEGTVTMRPVGFDAVTGHISPRGGSPFWYRASDGARNKGHFFVAFTDDGENCAVMAVCERGVQQQFGPADARYTFGPLVVLAWNKPIVVQ